MKIKSSLLIRWFVVLFVFITINLFGLLDFHNDSFFLLMNTYDLFLLLLNILLIVFAIQNKLFRTIITREPIKYLLYIYLFIIIVYLSMPLRGSISVIWAIRAGRHYLIIPLGFFIYYDIIINENRTFYFKLFSLIAFISTLQIIINAISPEFINSTFNAIGRAEEGFKNSYQRNLLISKSMIFPHIMAIYYFQKLISDKFNIDVLFYFLFFLLGSSLQGFRIYFGLLFLILFISIFIHGKLVNKSYTIIVFSFLIIPVTFFIDSNYLNNQITGKIYSTYFDVTQGEGTYKGRLDRVQIRQLPMLIEKPFFGWGFIHYKSDYGSELNLSGPGNDTITTHGYGLYSVDHGYITILLQFGILGVLFIFTFFLKIIRYLYFNYRIEPNIYMTTISIIIILVLSLSTHGALTREFGLLPFTVMFGMCAKINNV